jgi:myosin-5
LCLCLQAGILFNLKCRHIEGNPYTRTGDIIIAVNPFQWFTFLYTDAKRTYYSNRLVWEVNEQDPRDEMEPHVYECSSLAYKGLAFGGLDQSILVSGESGAGKTETVKICMNHMASVQKGLLEIKEGDTPDELDPVVKRVVQSNPLLEAFGNSKTRRNDNSSRFGKYLQLQFDNSVAKTMDVNNKDPSRCVLAGSKCEVYLLEKNRVTGHDMAERTYHIFYQVLAAPDSEKKKFWDGLPGTHNQSFKYIMDQHTLKIEGMTDEEHYHNTVETLALVGVKDEKLKTLVRAICICLQCGNLIFGPANGDKDTSEITSSKEMTDLAELMGVTVNDLAESFTQRTMATKTETYKVPLNPDAAKDAADAFAREVYGKLFLWLVKEINSATCAEDNYKTGEMKDFGIVGLLDIFGFESFAVNRFEQLCINYANEKLQQKFTEDTFRAVQLEYEAQGIDLADISYDDNTDVLDLIEGRTGLLAMLNEECVRPGGNDVSFVSKALSSNKKSGCLIVNLQDRMSFGVHHYAGKVMYTADGFVGRNQDTLPTDLEDIAKKSSNEIICNDAVQVNPEAPAASGGGGKRAPPKRQKSNLVAPTVWGKYKTQLASLMGSLRKTESRYIRCVKPNMAKKPLLMDHIPTLEQLRSAGVVAAVTLARSAFPNKLENSAVKFRYGGMWNKKEVQSAKTPEMTPDEALRCDCEAILKSALSTKEVVKGEKKQFVVGITRSYFKAGILEYLEANRATGLDAQAVTIQALVRGMIGRRKFNDIIGFAAKQEQMERDAAAAAEQAERDKEAAAEEAKHAEKRAQEAKAAAEKAEFEKEAIEREKQRTADREKYLLEIEDVKVQMKEADESRKERVKEAKEYKEQLEAEIAELKENTSDDAKKLLMEPKKVAAQQKKKLDEQSKMIEFLKKENKKIRKDHDKIKEKFGVVQKNNDKLLKVNESVGGNFEDVDDSATKVSDKNENLIAALEQAKVDNKQLKEDVAKRQDDYMTQAETRLEYQKTMARILNMIQEASKEPQIVEDTVVIALECEAESKSIMAALEAETDEDED